MRDDDDRDAVHRGRPGRADEGRETVIRPVERRWRTKEPVDEQEASDPPQTSGDDRSTVVRRAPRSSDIVLDQGLPASEAEAGPEKSRSLRAVATPASLRKAGLTGFSMSICTASYAKPPARSEVCPSAGFRSGPMSASCCEPSP